MSNTETFSLKDWAVGGLPVGRHTVRITSVTGKMTGENSDKPRVTIGGTAIDGDKAGTTQFWGYAISKDKVGKNNTPQINFLIDDLVKFRFEGEVKINYDDPEDTANGLKPQLLDKIVDIENYQNGQYVNTRVKGLAKLSPEGLPTSNGRQAASII